MMTTIKRLLIIFAIALTGFGWGLRTIVRLYDETDSELRLICVADEPMYLNQTVLTVELTREDHDKPITTIILSENDARRGPAGRYNMEITGNIDNIVGSSYLGLTINNPGIDNDGRYVCQIYVLGENNVIIKKSAIIDVNVKENEAGQLQTELVDTILSLTMNLSDLEAKWKTSLQSSEKKIQELLISIKSKQHKETNHTQESRPQTMTQNNIVDTIQCYDGWTYYKSDKTCLKAVGIIDTRLRVDWQSAKNVCQTQNTDLLKIHNKHIATFSHNMIKGIYWIDAVEENAIADLNFKQVNRWDFREFDSLRSVACVSMSNETLNFGSGMSHYCDTRLPYVCSGPSRNIAYYLYASAYFLNIRSSKTTVIFPFVDTDIGSKFYDRHTGKFTAPYEGEYFAILKFNGPCRESKVLALLMKNQHILASPSNDYLLGRVTAIYKDIYMKAGDQLSIKVSVSRGRSCIIRLADFLVGAFRD